MAWNKITNSPFTVDSDNKISFDTNKLGEYAFKKSTTQTITWDGDPTGKETRLDGAYVKVSSVVLNDLSSLGGSRFNYLDSSGEEKSLISNEVYLIELYTDRILIAVEGTCGILIVKAQTATWGGVEFTQGIWFSCYPSDITKNRVTSLSYTEYTNELNITWSGDITGITDIYSTELGPHYKVSDTVLTKDQVSTGIAIVPNDPDEVCILTPATEETNIIHVNVGIPGEYEYSFATIITQDIQQGDTTLHAGTYFLKMEDGFYINRLCCKPAGGSSAITEKQYTINKGLSTKLLPNMFTSAPTGKEFDGWLIGSTEGSKVQPGTNYAFADSTNVYASWKDTAVSGPLCFTANTAGSTISMRQIGTPTLGQNFQTSTDETTWTEFIPNTTTITLTNIGDKVYFKGNNPNGISQSSSIYYKFDMTGSIAVSGNIMSLIDNGACNTLVIPNNYCFYSLFISADEITSAPSLPATTLKNYCYSEMFMGCLNLAISPTLPATTLAEHCYENMFNACINLTTPPTLSATTLADGCYQDMFSSCTSLTIAPALPATTLAPRCYSGMFSSCRALITPPALPATNISYSCYASMFMGCIALTSVPALPATTLDDTNCYNCYLAMFYGCTSLIVSDVAGSDYNNEWRLPTVGTFTGSFTQQDMFTNCLGTRSSNNLIPVIGEYKIYYTQNPPV